MAVGDLGAARFAPLLASVAIHNDLDSESGFAKYVGCISSLRYMRLDNRAHVQEVLKAIETHIGPLRGCCWRYGVAAADTLSGVREEFRENHADLLSAA